LSQANFDKNRKYDMAIKTNAGGSSLSNIEERRFLEEYYTNWSSTTTFSATQRCGLDASSRFREHRLIHSPFPMFNADENA
jgi:hypothetical protein